MSSVLGISAYYHDAAAALVVDGEVIAAAEEERFTRRKHDSRLPVNAMWHCLHRLEAMERELDAVVFYEKPLTTFERLMETVFAEGRRGRGLFRSAMPTWATSKLWIPLNVERALREFGVADPPRLEFAEHHFSHAASAFYPSPFDEAAVLTVDGVGEWATTSIAVGDGSRLEILRQVDYPHSLGLLYSAATSYCGFKVNSGEYKLMGLAPYGEPTHADRIRSELIDLRNDGSFQLNTDHFGFSRGESMITPSWTDLFGGPAREQESELDPRIADVAASFQLVLEDAVVNVARAAQRETGSSNLAMAGGVALNCVANRRVAVEAGFDRVWIQPASSDAGGALGAALAHTWSSATKERSAPSPDGMHGSLLGPQFDDQEIASFLDEVGAPAESLADDELHAEVARLLDTGSIVAVCRGRMEYGPRALGNRSILADPRNVDMQRDLNLRTKLRESFRPFAPSVLAEHASDYFELAGESPYMLMVGHVVPELRRSSSESAGSIAERIGEARSDIPAVTHVDWSARVQTVSVERHPAFHALISAFHELTGCPLVVNTSFNIRGQPIVCTPADAYECFMSTGIDALVLGGFLLRKQDQPNAAAAVLAPESLVLD